MSERDSVPPIITSSVAEESVYITESNQGNPESDSEKVIQQSDKEETPFPTSFVSGSSGTGAPDTVTKRDWPVSLDPTTDSLPQPTPTLPGTQQAIGPSETPPAPLMHFRSEGQETLQPSLVNKPSNVDGHLLSSRSSFVTRNEEDNVVDRSPYDEASQSESGPAATCLPPAPHLDQLLGGIYQGPGSTSSMEDGEMVSPDPFVVDGTEPGSHLPPTEQQGKDPTGFDVLTAQSLVDGTDTVVTTEAHAMKDTPLPVLLTDEEVGMEEAVTDSLAGRNGSDANQTDVLSDDSGWNGNGNGSISNGTGNGVPGGYSSTREKSVFIRLSNRINNLETNMSLFSSYLEQISLR